MPQTASTMPLLTMEAANIYCGVAAPSPGDVNNSNHLRLTEVKLPGFEEQYTEHRAAGAPVSLEINTVFAKLECDFTLAGWTPQVASLIALWGSVNNQYWVYGALRDRVSGNIMQGVASIYGRLGKADPQQWRRGDTANWAYSIRGITKYKLFTNDGSPAIYEYDYFGGIFNIGGDGTDNQNILAALNLSSATPPINAVT